MEQAETWKPARATRHHVSKQRIVATFSLAEAQYDAMERALNAMGLQLTSYDEPLTPTQQKWVDAQGGDDKISKVLKNNKAFMNKMASAVYGGATRTGSRGAKWYPIKKKRTWVLC